MQPQPPSVLIKTCSPAGNLTDLGQAATILRTNVGTRLKCPHSWGAAIAALCRYGAINNESEGKGSDTGYEGD